MRRLLALTLLLAACASGPQSLDIYLQGRGITPPTESSFQTCRAYGCQKIDAIELSKNELKAIDKPFIKKAKTAEDERQKIKTAIATFEKIVGGINGTSEDIWGTFQKSGHKQQDCVDESTNTSIYLRLLANRGHLQFHNVGAPTSRVPIASPVTWPHQTATIIEKETGEIFAVDSWFHNNGAEPEIIYLKTWKRGWKPEERQ